MKLSGGVASLGAMGGLSDGTRGGHGDQRVDLHSHTYLTDGETSASDMWVSANALGHSALAITDHIGMEDPSPLLKHLFEEAKGWEGEPMRTLVGVEITMIPPKRVAEVARSARKAGAEIIIAHGETIAESVPPGTNQAALECALVDILAHPGLLTLKEAELARANGTILEVSARRGHSLTNGHVVRLALEAGAELVVDTDAHDPGQLITFERARQIARGAGLDEREVLRALKNTPEKLLTRLGKA